MVWWPKRYLACFQGSQKIPGIQRYSYFCDTKDFLQRFFARDFFVQRFFQRFFSKTKIFSKIFLKTCFVSFSSAIWVIWSVSQRYYLSKYVFSCSCRVLKGKSEFLTLAVVLKGKVRTVGTMTVILPRETLIEWIFHRRERIVNLRAPTANQSDFVRSSLLVRIWGEFGMVFTIGEGQRSRLDWETQNRAYQYATIQKYRAKRFRCFQSNHSRTVAAISSDDWYVSISQDLSYNQSVRTDKYS